MSGPSNALSIGQKIPPNPLKKKKKKKNRKKEKYLSTACASKVNVDFLTTKVDFVSRPTYNYNSDNFLGR